MLSTVPFKEAGTAPPKEETKPDFSWKNWHSKLKWSNKKKLLLVRILKYKGIENHNTYLIKCNQDESVVQESWIAQN